MTTRFGRLQIKGDIHLQHQIVSIILKESVLGVLATNMRTVLPYTCNYQMFEENVFTDWHSARLQKYKFMYGQLYVVFVFTYYVTQQPYSIFDQSGDVLIGTFNYGVYMYVNFLLCN